MHAYNHEHKPYAPDSGLLYWLHIVVSNAKAFILDMYHGLPKINLQAYLMNFAFALIAASLLGLFGSGWLLLWARLVG